MEDVTDDVFAGLMEGLDQIEAHARGGTTTLRVHVPQELDVAAIRARSGVSQPVFAQSIGINVATLKQWEQGRRRPQGPARVLLAMIEREPQVVARVLAGTRPDAMAASDPPPRFGSAEGGAKPRTRKAGVRRAGAA